MRSNGVFDAGGLRCVLLLAVQISDLDLQYIFLRACCQIDAITPEG